MLKQMKLNGLPQNKRRKAQYILRRVGNSGSCYGWSSVAEAPTGVARALLYIHVHSQGLAPLSSLSIIQVILPYLSSRRPPDLIPTETPSHLPTKLPGQVYPYAEQSRPFAVLPRTTRIALAKNLQFHARTKHIAIQHHSVREQQANGRLS